MRRLSAAETVSLQLRLGLFDSAATVTTHHGLPWAPLYEALTAHALALRRLTAPPVGVDPRSAARHTLVGAVRYAPEREVPCCLVLPPRR